MQPRNLAIVAVVAVLVLAVWYVWFHKVPCGNVVTLPNGERAVCPVGYNNKYSFGVHVAAGCDKDKDQCMACIGRASPASASWPVGPSPVPSGVDSGPTVAPLWSKYSDTYITNPMPLPASNCRRS